MPPPRPPRPLERALRDAALAYPETHEAFPWVDHRVVKVRGKVFVVMSTGEEGLGVSVKLPWSAEGALQFRFCAPTGYGLGPSGWVTATFGPKEKPPVAMLRSWIDESYRAVAPKRLVASLPPKRPTERKRAPRARRAKGEERPKRVAGSRRATPPAPPSPKRPPGRASVAGPPARGAARAPR